jgi:DNA helicase-2/ATP-dependent DNA helicase PcrA
MLNYSNIIKIYYQVIKVSYSKINFKLDNEQKKIVYSPLKRNILVKAPPGSGKTTVMSKRIEFLIKNNIINEPFKILGLTFSNSAANEMKKRLSDEYLNKTYITTFHSFAFNILKSYGQYVGIGNDFTLASDYQIDKIIKTLMKKYDPGKDVDFLKEEYKKWFKVSILKKNNSNCKYESLFKKILEKYRLILIKKNLIDFNHILVYINKLFDKNNAVLNYCSSIFKYIIIDEFQDTNTLQLELIKNIIVKSQNSNNILLLSDPNQAIYSFQGATIENIENAKEFFDCMEIQLNNNHRISCPVIQKLLKNISLKINGNLDEIDVVDEITLYVHNNESDENNHVTNIIKKLIENNMQPHEIAILAPSGSTLEGLNKMLEKNNIDTIYIPNFTKNKILKKYEKFFKNLFEYSHDENMCLVDIIKEIFKNKEKDIGIDFLTKVARKYDSEKFRNLTLNEKIRCVYNEFVLDFDIDYMVQNKTDKVFLSTIHSVKGLEFDNVIIMGLENGNIPFYTNCKKYHESNQNNIYLTEALNLLYVGISRAKKNLFLFCTALKNGHKKHGTCLLNDCVNFENS